MSAAKPPWDQFVKVGNPGLGQSVTLLHPVLSITFFLRYVDYRAVGQLYDEAMKLIQPQLTHYQAESMKRPAKITAAALGMIPTWMRKPKTDHSYFWTAYGGADLGCSPPGLELSLWAFPVLSPEEKREIAESGNANYGGEEITDYPFRTAIRLMLPVDHALGEASALVAWLRSLDLLASGNFESVESSYGLSSLAAVDRTTEKQEWAACSRYPGLDCFRFWQGGIIRPEPGYPDLVPLIKRAAWTLVLHELSVRALGGEAAVRQQLADTPEIRLTPLEHGLIVQAGERPALGDLNKGDHLPLLRKVAAVIRPVRVKKLAEKSEFWDHFYNIFDKDYG